MPEEAASGFLPWRAGVVWIVGTVVLLGALLFFAYVTGWPKWVDGCVDRGCYCEAFNLADVEAGVKGIRQPVNTWSNLYAIGTSLLIAIVMGLDRAKGTSSNVMKSSWWVADAYVFAALFLGLGSMWLHASISAAVSWMDGFSMYVFAAYLVFYTLDRGFAHKGTASLTRARVFFWGYPLTAIILTIVGALGVDSLYLILLLVAVYVALEFFYAGFIFDIWAMCFWLIGVFAMQNAVLFWALSQTGRPLCNPDSWFQPHGLLWHTLAGVMAVMMYFYWRREGAPAAIATAGAARADVGWG